MTVAEQRPDVDRAGTGTGAGVQRLRRRLERLIGSPPRRGTS
ncbi:hypothetical protein QFZ63_005458 [Streptomyces sp. B3I7]|nr:hypothetical protein [Streptomyces sp. B3I7]